MRGQQKFFNDFIEVSAPAQEQKKKGRSPLLNANRNTLLIHRFYYYMKIRELQYNKVLQTLEAEFFLSENRIVNVLDENYTEFKKVHLAKPTTKDLKALYPHLVW